MSRWHLLSTATSSSSVGEMVQYSQKGGRLSQCVLSTAPTSSSVGKMVQYSQKGGRLCTKYSTQQ